MMKPRKSDLHPLFKFLADRQRRPRAAWIVEWVLHRTDLPLPDLRPYILPHRWRCEKVGQFMRGIYWNSSFFTPSEALASINKLKPPGLFIFHSKKHVTYGDATHLFACLVSDLQIERTRGAKEMLLRWTVPAATEFDNKTGRWITRETSTSEEREYRWLSPYATTSAIPAIPSSSSPTK